MDYNEYRKNKDSICLIRSEEDIENYLQKEIKDGQREIKIIIDSRPEVYDEEYIEKIKKLSQKFIDLGCFVDVSFNVEKLNIKKSELERIVAFGARLEQFGGKLGFNEDLYNEYEFEEVVDAEYLATNFIEAVKAYNASPFEKLIIVQNYVTSRVYKEDKNNPANARSLIKVLNGQDIVCVGYAAMMDYLLGELGIKCLSQSCIVYEKGNDKFLGNHVNNIVYLDDEKYGVKGWYYLDCWDAVENGEEPFLKYTHCLIPLGDSKKFKNKKISVVNNFFSALYSEEEKEALYEELIDSSRMSELAAISAGLTKEYKECYERLDRKNKEVQERRKNAAQTLLKILMEENVGANFFADENVPYESSFQLMLANLMLEKPDENLLKRSIDGIKKYKEIIESQEEVNFDYMKAIPVECDVFEFLKQFEQGCFEREQEQLCLKMVEERLQCIKFAKYAKKIIEEAGKSKPISLSNYRKAIENANIVQGATREFAEVQASRAIEKTIKLAEQTFEKDAQNCFRKEAERRRVEENQK